jgi:hypothetical protein
VSPNIWLCFRTNMPDFIYITAHGQQGFFLPISKAETFLREALIFCARLGQGQRPSQLKANIVGVDLAYDPISDVAVIEVDTSVVLTLEPWELAATLSGLQALRSELSAGQL